MKRKVLREFSRGSGYKEFEHTHDCKEVEGVVRFSEMQLSDLRGLLKLRLEGKKQTYKIESCGHLSAVPQVLVGQKVVLHLDRSSVVGLQIIEEERVVFRVVLHNDTGATTGRFQRTHYKF